MTNAIEIIKLIESGNIKIARNRIQKYYRESPGLFSYYMGLSYCAERKFKDAVDCFTNSEKNGVNDHKLYYNIGTSYMEINEYEMAKLYLEKSIKLKEDNEECYINLSYLYYTLGDVKKAYRIVKRGMACCAGNKLNYIELKLIPILNVS